VRAVIQRVYDASVTVDGKVVGSIERGLLVYLGVGEGDTEEQLKWICEKIPKIRCFRDEHGKMNLDLKQVDGQILLVSQFTLLANLRKGNRPSYDHAADPKIAEALYDRAFTLFEEQGVTASGGVFGAHMHVRYTNDGPVTFTLDA
jgi:D-tyrosyl-tRNA(Tyr) deacylase